MQYASVGAMWSFKGDVYSDDNQQNYLIVWQLKSANDFSYISLIPSPLCTFEGWASTIQNVLNGFNTLKKISLVDMCLRTI